jgi:CheY-like chemotaxis protein
MDSLYAAVILLVEDDIADQKLIIQSLKTQKVSNSVKIADSGEAATEYLSAAIGGDPSKPMPDLILLDLNMPGMGGKEFLRRLKQTPGLADIPVVILTTSDLDKDVIESYRLHASGYIKKPCGLAEFQEVMKNLNDYWFVICKRVTHDTGIASQANKCFVG